MIADAALIDDRRLLEHYARTRDAKAFAELAKRYAGMVYGTCLRVTQNPDDAEDVSQECFLELARRAGTINSSLAGWLHKVAKTRSVNAIKKASALRDREHRAFADTPDDSSAWAEIAPYIDAAVERLPDNLRLPTVLHYFHGVEQTQIAGQLHVSQSTVSRHLDKAVAILREDLHNAGFFAPVAVLAVLLAGNASTAAPAALVAALGKMAIMGVGGSAGAVGIAAHAHVAAKHVFGTVTGKLALATLVVLIGTSAAYKASREVNADAAANMPAPATRAMPRAVPVAAPAVPATAVVSPMESSRTDPFQPPNYRRPVTDISKANAPIADLPVPRMFAAVPAQRGTPVSTPEPPQPTRRMAGLVMNNGLCAIVESDGQSQIVKPGDVLNDRLAVVDRIEPGRIILKTTGSSPRQIIVGLTPAPPAAPPSVSPPASPAPGSPPPGLALPGIPAARPAGRPMLPGVPMMRRPAAAMRR